jgi:hypothetical protein
MMKHSDCHICGERIREDQNAIEHSGAGQYVQAKQLGEGFVSIWMHPECATVLAMRLINDVMSVKRTAEQPARVVEELQYFAKTNLNYEGADHGTTIQQT